MQLVTFKEKLRAAVMETSGPFTNRTITERLARERVSYNYFTVIRGLWDLEKAGEIEVVRKAARGTSHPTVYRLKSVGADALESALEE